MTKHRIDTLNELLDAGQVEQAIAGAGKALDNASLAPDERMALLELRFDGHNLRLELAAALADAQAMDALARRHPAPALQAQAALALSAAEEKRGRYPQALRMAQRALRAARRSGQALLVGRALERLSGIENVAGNDPARALEPAQQALAVFESLGDLRWQARALQRSSTCTAPLAARPKPTRPRGARCCWRGDADPGATKATRSTS
jgi:tetratricopeptide (TPR) repeat protein